VNHNGDVGRALGLVDAAVDAGADAVKFQTFKADRLAAHDAPKAAYQISSTGAGESQYDMLRRLELSAEAHHEIAGHCHRKGVVFMSTPFDEESVNFLLDVGMTVFKIPSGEITNLRFLAHVAQKGRPMIVSTGMASLGEVEAAVGTIRHAGNRDLVLLHCVSAYPASPADANLRAMHTLAAAFDVPVGFSDHTSGIEVSLAAVALGACVIEKHLTLDRALPGPDHSASLEPAELSALVQGIRTVEASLGDGCKAPTASESNTASTVRRSLVAACDISAGTLVTEEHVTAKRPGTGLPPAMRPCVVGRTARGPIAAGTQFTLEMLV